MSKGDRLPGVSLSRRGRVVTNKPLIEILEEMAREMNETRPDLADDMLGGEPVEETDMARAKASTTKDSKAPLFTWAFQSAKTQVGGTMINYITQLNTDKTLSCNCPGWIFRKGSKDQKFCKHTRDTRVQEDLPRVLKAFKEGRTLQTVVRGAEGFVASADTTAQDSSADKIQYGRVIEI